MAETLPELGAVAAEGLLGPYTALIAPRLSVRAALGTLVLRAYACGTRGRLFCITISWMIAALSLTQSSFPRMQTRLTLEPWQTNEYFGSERCGPHRSPSRLKRSFYGDRSPICKT